MRRIGHGDTFGTGGAAIAAELAVPVDETFGRMFPGLVDDPANLLKETDETVLALKALGDAMRDANEGDPGTGPGVGDSPIPAAFTYFGQFLDHDITFDAKGLPVADMANPALRPRPNLDGLNNGRSIRLDLDCLYGGDAPRDGERMLVGTVSPNAMGRPAGKSDFNDLPREGRSTTNKEIDRAARIGDARNDENLIVSQLHVVFLKAHNALVSDLGSFAAAQRGMRQRFQLIVLDDFLPRICDPAVVADVRANGSGWNLGFTGALFMPVEFSAAAYRFGHSMIRTRYDYNEFFPDAGLDLLFTFTALSGNIGPFPAPAGQGDLTVPENWIIEWDRLLSPDGTSQQRARQINTLLSDFTFDLRNTFGDTDDGGGVPGSEPFLLAPVLAKRNLLRGYVLRLPTGQAVAREMGLIPLEGQALLDVLPTDELKAAAEPFKDRTPLWFYILAEAGDPAGPNGAHLGAVGSRIVCDAFDHFIRASENSVLDPGNPPEIESFTLAELIALAFRDEQG